METPTLPNGSILIYLEIDSSSPNIWLCFFAQNILIFPESDFRKKIRGKSLAVVEASLLFVVFQFNGSCFLQRRELSPKIDDGKRTDLPEIGAFTKDKSKQRPARSIILVDSIFL